MLRLIHTVGVQESKGRCDPHSMMRRTRYIDFTYIYIYLPNHMDCVNVKVNIAGKKAGGSAATG